MQGLLLSMDLNAIELSLPTSKEQSTLIALCQRRDDLTQMRAQEKCRLEAPENDYTKKVAKKPLTFLTVR